MADKIKAIKIKQKNGTYTGEIPISVNVQNVQWDENNHTLLDALGSVDISSSGKGNLQHQIDELDGDKISTNQFNSRLNDFLREQISEDTTDWLDDNVNPVGSAVIVDKTLTIDGAAADAKTVGDDFMEINKSLLTIQRLATNTDLNDVLTPGTYALHANSIYINTPEGTGEHGILEVWREIVSGTTQRTFQRFTVSYKAGRSNSEVWIRNYSNVTSSWTIWVMVSGKTVTRYYGSKISIIGDSIESFDDPRYRIYDNYNMYYPRGSVTDVGQTWWKRVSDASGMEIDVNASFSGARASKTNNALSFYDRVSSIGSPDLIFVALGTNDSYYAVEVGEYDFTTTYTSLTETTFRPAYIKGIKALQATYPNAKIVCIIKKMDDIYKESIIHIAKTLGVNHIDASDYIGEENTLHPGKIGMEQIASYVLYPTDSSFSQTHIPADAKAVEDKLKEIRTDLGAVQKIGVNRKNLYDSTTAKDDKAVWADGAEHNSPGNCCSDFIDISAYKNLSIFGTTLICFYNSSKEKISIDMGADTRFTERTFEVPVNATYIRISTKVGYKESVYIGDGLVNLTNVKEKHISILFVGNSLTHDSVSYVPYILSTLFPEIDFSIHIFYNGGTTLASQYNKFINDTPCANYSICENTYTWKTFWNKYTMEQVLETYKFDVVCMQDYFTFRDSFTESDLEGWNNCQSYIAAHYTGENPLKFITLMPAPVRDNWTSQEHPTTAAVYAATETAMKLFISDTVAEDVIPCGMGIYKAMQTSLDSLGDMEHLSHDGLHAQEGIPCLLQSYIVVLWILKELDLPKSIYASPIRITTSIFESLNVPGQNVGIGVITGTNEQNLLTQTIAIESIKDSSNYILNLKSLIKPTRLGSIDLDDVIEPGTYTLHTENTYLNKPTSDAEHGVLEVWDESIQSGRGRIFQRLTYSYKAGKTSGEAWIRSYSRTNSTWTQWIMIGGGVDDLKAALGYSNGFKVTYKNQFDISTVTDNKAIWSDGASHTSEGNCHSDYIDITKLDALVVHNTTRVMFYANNTSSSSKMGESDNGDSTLEIKTLEVPEGASYIKVTLKMTDKNICYVGDGMYDFTKYRFRNTITNAVTFLEQNKDADLKAVARNNINAQENLGIEYGANLFDPSTIITDTAIYANDGAERTREGYFASDFIDVTGLHKITVTGAEVVAMYDENKNVITPTLQPQSSTRNPVTYVLSSAVHYIRLCGTNRRLSYMELRNCEFSIPNMRLTESQMAGSDAFVTPEMFGAVGDGVTDDSDAFASAIADGRPIKLGAKTYAANLYIAKSNVIITGEWQVSKIIAADLTKPIIQINSDTAEYSSGELLKYITLKDFIIGERQDVLGLKARAVQSLWIEKIFFNRCWKGAFVFEGVWDSRVRDCDGLTCGNRGFSADDGRHNYAIVLADTVGMKTNALVIDGCRFEHSPRFLDIHGVFQTLITNSKFEAHTRAYDSNADYTPIRIHEKIKGLHFVNDIFTYNAVQMDTDLQVDPFNNGMPFISVNTLVNDAFSERITVFANCQFSTQPELVPVYFNGNETLITGCNFDRCASNAPIITLKDYSSLVNCDMVMSAGGGTAVKIDGAYTVVDNLRVFETNEDTSKPLVTVTNNAQRGYAKVLYNGTDRANLATAGTGGFGVKVEFIGMREYTPS